MRKLKYETGCYKLAEHYPTSEDINYEINLHQIKRQTVGNGFTWRIYNQLEYDKILSIDDFKTLLEDSQYFEKISDKKYKLINI